MIWYCLFLLFLTDNMTRNAGGWNLTIDIIKWGIMEYIKSLMTRKLLYCSLIPNLCYEKININTKEVGFLFVSLFFILFFILLLHCSQPTQKLTVANSADRLSLCQKLQYQYKVSRIFIFLHCSQTTHKCRSGKTGLLGWLRLKNGTG